MKVNSKGSISEIFSSIKPTWDSDETAKRDLICINPFDIRRIWSETPEILASEEQRYGDTANS